MAAKEHEEGTRQKLTLIPQQIEVDVDLLAGGAMVPQVNSGATPESTAATPQGGAETHRLSSAGLMIALISKSL